MALLRIFRIFVPRTPGRVMAVGRTGISYEEVQTIALALLARGETPTINRVRALLGTGSNSTIAQHLRQFQQARRAATALAPEAGDPLPPTVPDAVMGAAERLWQLALATAAETFAAERQELATARDGALADLQEQRAAVDALAAEVQTLKGQLQAQRLALEDQLARSREDAKAQGEARQALATRLEERDAQLEALCRRGEALQAEAKAQLAESRAQADREREQLLLRLDAVRQEEWRRGEARVQALEAKFDKASAERRALEGQLREARAELNLRAREHQGVQEALQGEVARWRAVCEALQGKLTRAHTALEAEAQGRIADREALAATAEQRDGLQRHLEGAQAATAALEAQYAQLRTLLTQHLAASAAKDAPTGADEAAG